MTFDPIFTMAMTTLGTALGICVYQLVSLRREQKFDAAPELARIERPVRRRL